MLRHSRERAIRVGMVLTTVLLSVAIFRIIPPSSPATTTFSTESLQKITHAIGGAESANGGVTPSFTVLVPSGGLVDGKGNAASHLSWCDFSYDSTTAQWNLFVTGSGGGMGYEISETPMVSSNRIPKEERWHSDMTIRGIRVYRYSGDRSSAHFYFIYKNVFVQVDDLGGFRAFPERLLSHFVPLSVYMARYGNV